MATYYGNDASVKLVTSGGSVATAAEVQTWSLTMTTDMIDTSSMGSTARTFTAGHSAGTANITFNLDPDNAAQVDIVERASLDVEFFAEGTDSGDTKYSGTFIVTSVEKAASFDALATMSADLQLTGALTIGTV